MGAAVVIMAFDEQGQAATYEDKVRICRRSYNLLRSKSAFIPEVIMFNGNVLTIVAVTLRGIGGGWSANFTSNSLHAHDRPDLIHLPTTKGEHRASGNVSLTPDPPQIAARQVLRGAPATIPLLVLELQLDDKVGARDDHRSF